MFHIFKPALIIGLLACPAIASAQGKFLTAAEVKPILNATKGSWIAVREYDGQDLLYFTHLLAWRCGLTSVRYALNGAKTTQDWPLTPCNEDSPTPAAIGEDQPIYLTQPLNSITAIQIDLIYDDDTTDSVTFERKSVLIP